MIRGSISCIRPSFHGICLHMGWHIGMCNNYTCTCSSFVTCAVDHSRSTCHTWTSRSIGSSILKRKKKRKTEKIVIQLEAEVFNPPDIFPLIPILNKSRNIERCVNNMLQIIQNMMVSQCSELELSIFRGTTLSGQHPLIQPPDPMDT